MSKAIKHMIVVVFMLLCMILYVFLLGSINGCATLQSLIGQPQLQTYTFNYNGKDYSALLPEQVPMPPGTAVQKPQSYWGIVYAIHVHYNAGEQPKPRLPCASFWFTPDLGVFGFVWHTLESDGTVKHEGWLYVKGIPVGTTTELFDKMLEDLLTKPNIPGA